MGKQNNSFWTGAIFLLIVALILVWTAAAWCAQSDYDGIYAGSYSGDDSGYWVAVVDADGDNEFLSYSTSAETGDTGSLDYWGEPESGVGSFYTSATDIQGSEIDIYIDSSDGSVTGTWYNSDSSEDGNITGEKVTSSDYAGTSSGTYIGDDTGTWSMNIDSDGYITGTKTSDTYGTSDFEGGCHPDGHILAAGFEDDGWFAVVADISGSSISGYWIAQDGSEGIITGTVDNNADDGSTTTEEDDDDDEGGCFIQSLMKP